MDKETFSAEVMGLLPVLHRVSMGILRREADAQDAVQQALLKAWAARARCDGQHFRAWLSRIVINECRNIQRQRMRVTPVEEVAGETGFRPPDLDVAEAIAALHEKYRLPFLLKYACQYTEREIALALRLPLTTVKSRLHTARKMLAKQLSDREVVFE